MSQRSFNVTILVHYVHIVHSKHDKVMSDCVLAQLSLCWKMHTTHAGTRTHAQPESFTTEKTAATQKTMDNQLLKR